MSLREALQGIYDDRGTLTPAIVVEVARADKHPLHSRFEWDDSVAGEAWRRQQAHELIRSCKITFRDAKDNEKHVRAFHATRNENSITPTYEPIEKVLNDPLLTKIVLADMKREWLALKRRYDQFEEFRRMVLDDIAAA